jgi:hypothetical protein
MLPRGPMCSGPQADARVSPAGSLDGDFSRLAPSLTARRSGQRPLPGQGVTLRKARPSPEGFSDVGSGL